VYYTYIKIEIIILYNTLLSWHHFGVVSVSRMVSDNVISNKYLKCVYYFITVDPQWKNLDYPLQREFELLTR